MDRNAPEYASHINRITDIAAAVGCLSSGWLIYLGYPIIGAALLIVSVVGLFQRIKQLEAGIKEPTCPQNPSAKPR